MLKRLPSLWPVRTVMVDLRRRRYEASITTLMAVRDEFVHNPIFLLARHDAASGFLQDRYTLGLQDVLDHFEFVSAFVKRGAIDSTSRLPIWPVMSSSIGRPLGTWLRWSDSVMGY